MPDVLGDLGMIPCADETIVKWLDATLAGKKPDIVDRADL
jgi:hypothetical protein